MVTKEIDNNSKHVFEENDNETICLDSDEEPTCLDHHASKENDNSCEHGIEELEKKLLQEYVLSEKDAFNLYNKYAYAVGFSVRRGKQYYHEGTKEIRLKNYYCSKQGWKEEITGSSSNVFNQLETRTGCNAMVAFEVDKEGIWKVRTHIKDHNHEFAKEYEKYLLRSVRSISKAQGNTLESFINSGISLSSTVSYLSKECGGISRLGFTQKDAYNLISSKRKALIEKGDAQSLVNYFKSKANDEGMFYWDVELDDEGRMMNFFWRDGRSLLDYDSFGDVVVFDATYRTNRYNLVCAPFIGINHHWQNILLGCAFLSDETTSSFEWAFNSFLESMGRNSPKTIMTDQDKAMINAIEKVFPNSRHRLCLWHIAKNAPSHLGKLNSNGKFSYLFYKCLSGCETEEEFDTTWKKMIADHGLENHSWLNRLFKLRGKWCTTLNNDTFDAGLKTTSRSEGTNHMLNGIGDKTTSLTKFVGELDRKNGEWRQKEAAADYYCKHGNVVLKIKECALLQQAAKHYTHKLYKFFEEEFLEILATSHVENKYGDNLFRFDVALKTKWGLRTSIVLFDENKMTFQCSCRKFESMGILCTHALVALKAKNISEIPCAYLLQRWGQNAKKRVDDSQQYRIFQMTGSSSSQIMFTNRAMRFAYDLVTQSQLQEATRVIVWQGLESIDSKLDEYLKKHSSLDSQTSSVVKHVSDTEELFDDQVLDPRRIRTKGRGKGRIKGHWEKRPNNTSATRKKAKTSTLEMSTVEGLG